MVRRWDIIAIGNLSRNLYWGERDDKAYRPALCTSTVVAGDGFSLIVDPSFGDGVQMASELYRRTGLKLSDVNTVFLTHEHGDHVAGLKHFAHASWLAPTGVAKILNDSGEFERPIEPAPERLFDCIEPVHTPGHTFSHHSLKFSCEGYRVVIAGDAAMTRDFWAERKGYFNCVDFDAASRSIERLAGMADLVIPGHDN